MEPTKNNNSIGSNNSNNGASSDPVFQGMPKPGQPLASTPKFSAHAPSALDRIMNPNLNSNSSSGPIQTAPVTPASTTLKPVNPSPSLASAPIPATSVPTPIAPVVAPSSAQSSSVSSIPTSSFKPYTPPTFSTPPTSSTSPSVSTLSSASASNVSSKSSTPASSFAPSSPVSSKVGSASNGQQFSQKPAHKNTLILIITAIVALLLLVGGGYYWYKSMSNPGGDTTKDNMPATTGQNGTQTTNTSRPASAFPTAATRPVTTSTSSSSASSPYQTTKPSTPAKPTRVTTPFTSTQRSIISSYISSNIDALAVPKSNKLYEVTDVTFDGPDRALVQYTNGTASYTAVAVASIDTADNVRILSFSLLEK